MPQLLPMIGSAFISGALALGLGGLLPAASAFAFGQAIVYLGTSSGATYDQPRSRL